MNVLEYGVGGRSVRGRKRVLTRVFVLEKGERA